MSIPDFSGFNFTSQQPRGLRNFINEIRNCDSAADERTRVDAELGNIRLKFSQPAAMNAYQKKKYCWKLCYINMLGYDVDFGHAEIITLISSSKYQEKAVGYMAASLLLAADDDLLKTVLGSIRSDLIGMCRVVCDM
jgi:AP-2 complex subunit alpha